MSNAATKIGDIINPEVMADMIEAKLTAECKLTPYAKVDTKLQGVPGNTITVPSWNYIGDAEDFDPEAAFDDNSEMETAKLTAGSTTFTVKCAAKSVSILQTAINSGLGDPVGQAGIQLTKSIKAKIDNDILASAYTSPNAYNGTAGVIGYNGIVEAVCQFEDEEDGIEKVMFIHPKQEATLLKDEYFRSADKFTAGVAVNGSIGKIAGCWVKKSAKVAMVDAVSAVQGVYTVKIATVANGDKITIAGVETTLDSTSGASAGAAVTAIKTKTFADYTVTGASDTLTFTEKTGKEGTGKPACSSDNENTVFTITTTTAGVAASPALYKNPIIKMEADSAETEYTEEELPALTIYLKKGVQVDHEWFPKKQKHDITAAEYYGTALTNASKVIIAKFAQNEA